MQIHVTASARLRAGAFCDVAAQIFTVSFAERDPRPARWRATRWRKPRGSKPAFHFVIGKAEPAMVEFVAAEFEFMRREIDDHDAPARL